MSILIKKDNLQTAVGIVEKNTARNITLPVLNNILFKTGIDKISLTATNLEIGVWVSIPSKGDIKTELILPPKVLMSFLNTLNEGNIEIKPSDKNKQITIEQNSFKTSIKGGGADDFPILPQINTKKQFIIKAQQLIEGLEQVINSTATSELKPELTGVLFSFNENGLKLAATDTFRLSECVIKQQNPLNIKEQIIIPTHTAIEIIRIFQNPEEDLCIFLDKNQIMIENKNNNKFIIKLISKLIEGDYPNYQQIIPQSFETTITLPKNELIKHVRAASLFSSKINDIKITITTNALKIQTEDYNIGSYNSEIIAQTEGPEKEISFNHHFLLDGLQNIKGEEVVLKINQKETPALLQNPKQKEYLYLLMPIRA